jgi:Ca2+-binding RTX toxin-like protein
MITGGGANDAMIGGAGDDTYVVDVSTDIVTELAIDLGVDLVKAAASYTLNTGNAAGVENLTLTGAATINGTGNALNNTIIGNVAANVLNGGLGADTLTGGAGNDSFVLNATDYQSFHDIITDFKASGLDKLQLSKTIFTGLQSATPTAAGVALTASDFLSGTSVTASTNSGQHLLYDSDSGALYYDGDGSGVNNAFQIALLGIETHAILLLADIFVIV